MLGSVRESGLPSVASFPQNPLISFFFWTMIPAQNWKILVRTDFSEKFRVVPKWPQKRIFKFLKNCSLLFPGFIMHVHVIHHVLKQTIYLGKFWFLSYWPKCSQPIRFLNQVCLSNIDELAWIFAYWYKFKKS